MNLLIVIAVQSERDRITHRVEYPNVEGTAISVDKLYTLEEQVDKTTHRVRSP